MRGSETSSENRKESGRNGKEGIIEIRFDCQ